MATENGIYDKIHRRFFKTLQALSCYHFLVVHLYCNFGLLFFFILLLFTPLFFVPLLCAVWIYLDSDTPRKAGRRSQWVRRWRLWKYMAEYFPITLHKTVDLDPSKNYIFPFHPHGIFCFGGFVNFATEGTKFEELFPGLTSHLLILDGHFKFPLYRDYLMLSGAGAVNPAAVDYKLTKLGPGHSVCIAVGGSAEALLSSPTKYQLKVLPRKGFIKAALRTGSSLVPVFSFGETSVVDQTRPEKGTWMFSFQERTRQLLGFAPIVIRGRILNQMPFRKPINTVVGSAIDVPKIENPTNEEVEKWHGVYLEELRKLYNENKAKYGDAETELEFC